jgi:hypothetical protein
MGAIAKTIGLWLVGRALQRKIGGNGRAADVLALVAVVGQLALSSKRGRARRTVRPITEPQSGVRYWS